MASFVRESIADSSGQKQFGRPLTVWVGRGYPAYHNIYHGQKNAKLKIWPMRFWTRLDRRLDCVALVPPIGDLVHAFNAVPLFTPLPFLITFEDYCPRVPEDRYIGWLERWLRIRLLSERCIALVAMSEYARRQFRYQHRNFDRFPELAQKLQVIYPALPLRRSSPKKAGDRLRLLFVGRTFMAKGGPAVVKAHKQLRKNGIPVETTIVSLLQPSVYLDPPSRLLIASSHDFRSEAGIRYFPGLFNHEVQQLMAEADYLLFPSFHETFGYVALEAMAWGTPVISTRTCAFPEIIAHADSGFLLDFVNEENVGKWIWLYRNREPGYTEAYLSVIDSMATQMVEILEERWQRRSEYESLSAGSIVRMNERFNPEVARQSIELLYHRVRS